MNCDQQKLLVAIYNRQPLVVDRLHHTVEFTSMCLEFNSHFQTGFSQHDIYQELLRLRKSRSLPTKTTIKARKPRRKTEQGNLF